MESNMDNENDSEINELYRQKLLGLAESALMGKLAIDVIADLKEIAADHKAPISAVKKDFAQAKLQISRNNSAVKNTLAPAPPAFEYSKEAVERAMRVWECRNKSDCFHRDFNRAGYTAERLYTKVAQLVSGFRHVNLRSWGDARDVLCGTQVGITGSSGAGKSQYVKHLLRFIDCSPGKEQARIEEISDCSDFYLALAGGEDGKALADKLIEWDELHSPGSLDYTKQMRIMWQATTRGNYIHRSSVGDLDGSGRKPIEYKLYGTLHHLFTSTDPPAGYEVQFRNRTLWVRLSKSENERWEIVTSKLGGKVKTRSILKVFRP